MGRLWLLRGYRAGNTPTSPVARIGEARPYDGCAARFIVAQFDSAVFREDTASAKAAGSTFHSSYRFRRQTAQGR